MHPLVIERARNPCSVSGVMDPILGVWASWWWCRGNPVIFVGESPGGKPDSIVGGMLQGKCYKGSGIPLWMAGGGGAIVGVSAWCWHSLRGSYGTGTGRDDSGRDEGARVHP